MTLDLRLMSYYHYCQVIDYPEDDVETFTGNYLDVR